MQPQSSEYLFARGAKPTTRNVFEQYNSTDPNDTDPNDTLEGAVERKSSWPKNKRKWHNLRHEGQVAELKGGGKFFVVMVRIGGLEPPRCLFRP